MTFTTSATTPRLALVLSTTLLGLSSGCFTDDGGVATGAVADSEDGPSGTGGGADDTGSSDAGDTAGEDGGGSGDGNGPPLDVLHGDGDGDDGAACEPGDWARIDGVAATTSMGECCGGSLAAMVDGTGLSEMTELATHDCTDAGAWKSNTSQSAGQVRFDLGDTYDVDMIGIWNSGLLSGTRGAKNIALSTSLDGVTFEPIVGAPATLAQQSACPTEATIIDVTTPVRARYVRLEIFDNYGATNTALGEVMFGGIRACD